MTKAVIVFFISLACYLVAMGVFALVKFIINKRKIAKELKENNVIDGEVNDEQSKE